MMRISNLTQTRAPLYFAIMAVMFIIVGQMQSWNLSLAILNLCLISAIMSLGINIQWGYAGLFNVGIMGFAALGGLAAVIISAPPVPEAWDAGGAGVLLSAVIAGITSIAAIAAYKLMPASRARMAAIIAICLIGFLSSRGMYITATAAIEKVEPARTGFLGGLGLPIVLAWPVGGALAGAIAWVIGKTALGLRSDYLAIATLGISEIIVAVMKNEDWMTRGVKNVNGLPRPVPYEIDLQQAQWFLDWVAWLGLDSVTFSSIFVKLCYAGLFTVVLVVIFILSQRALNSPWGTDDSRHSR